MNAFLPLLISKLKEMYATEDVAKLQALKTTALTCWEEVDFQQFPEPLKSKKGEIGNVIGWYASDPKKYKNMLNITIETLEKAK